MGSPEVRALHFVCLGRGKGAAAGSQPGPILRLTR